MDLNFVPTWARQVPGSNPYAHFEGRGERSDRPERGRDRRPERRARPRGAPGPGQPSGGRPPPRNVQERPGLDRTAYPPAARRAVAPEAAPVEIAFIPERARLAALVHDLHLTRRAFPLADLAMKFLSNPDCYLVKVEVRRPHRPPVDPHHGRPGVQLFQCLDCKALFLDQQSAEAHAVARHLDRCFVVEDIVTEPPVGNFVCIARCRLSGELLGPPNYHGYNARLLELHRTRFAHLSLDDYRSRVETVRDPALVEKWKAAQRTQTVFKRKGAEPPQAMKRTEAEAYFREKALPGMLHHGQRFVVPARGTANWEDALLRQAIRAAWAQESRFPASLLFALRPAFRHMHLHLFKVSGGANFVTSIRPHPIPGDHAVAPIREVLRFLHAQPGCTRQQLVEGLRPGAAPDSAEVAAVISPLRWLIEKGHLIEFFNGTLALPMSGGQPAGRAAAPSRSR
ncbi:MAG: hypothetical protein NTV49_01465 [Kiritimatiellaeota bacterium]|nr:hypothetical protein [Kiritimatiellota bacterium]